MESVNRIKRDAGQPVAKMPEEIQSSLRALKPEQRRFHGSKISLTWFPFPWLASPCADKFGYMSSAAVTERDEAGFQRSESVVTGTTRWVDGRSGSRSESGIE